MSTIAASTTTTTAYKVAADTTGTLVLQTGATPTTAVTIDGSQNVGIGVTPSAWYSTYKGFDVNAWGGLGASSTLVGLYGNAYFSSGANYKYKTSAAATMYLQDGTHSWHVAASGTAGNTITFTQAMTLDANGALLVGTTNLLGAQGLAYAPSAQQIALGHTNGSASGLQYLNFLYNSGSIGSITQNGTTGVLYNLTSDYRLKNNQEALMGLVALFLRGERAVRSHRGFSPKTS